jgi:two-component system sensor histidine kinase UhpB
LRRISVAALEEVQRLARGLRPSVLDDLGLCVALKRYVADYGKSNGITAAVQESNRSGARLPQPVETTLYRIAQEALSNTAKYARAHNVRVLLDHRADCVQMTVTDDGCGFDVASLGDSQGLGLCGMRERAALLDGSVTIKSRIGAGTTVTVRVPLEEESRVHEEQDTCVACR